MGQQGKGRRLDEILISQGLISEDQAREALLRQKAHGGKFGSQLLYHRYIDEPSLIRALEIQFNCAGVVLSDLKIPPILCKMIPPEVAFSRKVIAFAYDAERCVLKVACEDPNDQQLVDEIKFVAKAKNVEFYIAAEIALDTAIARYYRGLKVSLDDNLQLEIPDNATGLSRFSGRKSRPIPGAVTKPITSALLITDSSFAVPLLQSLLERDGYHVKALSQVEQASEIVSKEKFDAIFIDDAVSEAAVEMIDRARKRFIGTVVHYYKSPSELLIQNEALSELDDTWQKTLDLLTALISSKTGQSANHNGRVGQYTDKLCRRLKIPVRDRLTIVAAAHLHDLARYYYRIDDRQDNRHIIQLTVKLLTSLNYPVAIVDILRNMYEKIADNYFQSLPIAMLGGNIITITDLFCDGIPANTRLSLEKFESIKRRLHDLKGRFFLPEVVDTFIAMVQDEILQNRTIQYSGQVMIYGTDLSFQHSFETRLKSEGFRTVSLGSPEAVVELCNRSEPDLMVLVIPGDYENVRSRVNDLSSWGVNFERIPSFLLVDSSAISHLTDLMEEGMEDIVALDDNLDLFMTKVRKLQTKISARNQKAEDTASGARGRLADINLIDLIQALGPGFKTVRITVQAGAPVSETLNIYLKQGAIIYAATENKTGPEAVFEGLTWTDGNWTVEPVASNDIPPQNNHLSNESILMEGCRLLDETIKKGRLL